MWTVPAVSAFKAQFVRDFSYAPTTDPSNDGYVMDADIQAAYNNAILDFNPSLFGTDAQVTMVFLWLAAFYLVWSIQNSTAGLGSQSKFPISSKSVGGIALSFSIPERYTNHPKLSIYTQNGYGMMYLSFAIPQMVGNVIIGCGPTGTVDIT